jgi:hypothetical protein
MAQGRLGDAAEGPVCGRGEALSTTDIDAKEGVAEESGSTARGRSGMAAPWVDLGPRRARYAPLGLV